MNRYLLDTNHAGLILREGASALDRLLAVADFDEAAAEDFGRIHAYLQSIGKPIPQVDTQIAATARTRNMSVATADAHFRLVPHLAVVHLLAE